MAHMMPCIPMSLQELPQRAWLIAATYLLNISKKWQFWALQTGAKQQPTRNGHEMSSASSIWLSIARAPCKNDIDPFWSIPRNTNATPQGSVLIHLPVSAGGKCTYRGIVGNLAQTTRFALVWNQSSNVWLVGKAFSYSTCKLCRVRSQIRLLKKPHSVQCQTKHSRPAETQGPGWMAALHAEPRVQALMLEPESHQARSTSLRLCAVHQRTLSRPIHSFGECCETLPRTKRMECMHCAEPVHCKLSKRLQAKQEFDCSSCSTRWVFNGHTGQQCLVLCWTMAMRMSRRWQKCRWKRRHFGHLLARVTIRPLIEETSGQREQV